MTLKPGTVEQQILEALEAKRPIRGGLNPLPAKLDGPGSDNKPVLDATAHLVDAHFDRDLGRKLEALDRFGDLVAHSPWGADEQDSKNEYGANWTWCPIWLAGAIAREAGVEEIAAGAHLWGLTLAGRLELAAAACGVREIQRADPPIDSAPYLLAGAGAYKTGLDAIALPGKRSWVRGKGESGAREAHIHLDSIEQSVCLALLRGVPFEPRSPAGRSTPARYARAIEGLFGASPWLLTPEERSVLVEHIGARDRIERSIELMRWVAAFPTKYRVSFRRYERAVAARLALAHAGSTASIGCLWFEESNGLGYYASPEDGRREQHVRGFTSAWEGEYGCVLRRADGLEQTVFIDRSVGRLLWTFDVGGHEPAMLDGEPLEEWGQPVEPPAPTPRPPAPREESTWKKLWEGWT